jgi:hypothetical protein
MGGREEMWKIAKRDMCQIFVSVFSAKAVISLTQKQICEYTKEPLGTIFFNGVYCIFRQCLVILFILQIRKLTNTNKI